MSWSLRPAARISMPELMAAASSSTNDGTSWTAINSGLTATAVGALAVSGPNLFAGTYHGGVFLSTNNGTSWTAVNSGLANVTVWDLAAAAPISSPEQMVSAFFSSTNSGTSWTAVNIGLTYARVLTLAGWCSHLYAGTYGGGVWRRPLSEMSATDLPTQFGVGQNYPNPFNTSTTIPFSVPFRTLVSLKVYDALGREVSDLVSEELCAGTHSRQWSAAGQATGIYFCRLNAGNVVAAQRLLVLR